MTRMVIGEELRAQVIARAMAGMPPVRIHLEFHDRLRLSTIYQILSAARKRGHAIRRFPPTPRPSSGIVARVVVWEGAMIARLRAAAERRDVSPSALVGRIVETVLAEDMIGAVLDDGEAADGH